MVWGINAAEVGVKEEDISYAVLLQKIQNKNLNDFNKNDKVF